MRLIGVDPGLTTGVFVFDTERVTDNKHHHELSTLDAACVVRHSLFQRPTALAELIVERFNITAKTAKNSAQPEALEVIGMMRYIAHNDGIPFHLQNRADRKRVSDDMLRRVGWFSSIGCGHSNDAARHVLVRLAAMHPEHQIVQRALGAD